MKYEHFGNLLEELRLKYNMSREELAHNICTPKQIYRIEKGESEPSIYLLHQLSLKFRLDLNEYYKMYFTNHTLEGLEGIKSINHAIIVRDNHLLKSLIDNYEPMEAFKTGENLQHIYYGKALCSALLDEDYKKSLDYCYQGLRVECPEFNITSISKYMFSNVGLALLNCTSQNFFAMDNYDAGMLVLNGLLMVLESYVINSPYPLFRDTQFFKKFYQAILYNMGVHLFEQGEYKKSLIFIERGIKFSLQESNFRHLSELLFFKFKLLYHKQNYAEAREYYNQVISLCKITNKESILNELDSSAKIDYPEIFK
ncbi:helix-turn-helix transcriptional regulator [Anaerocolumna sp. AGMB13025]|uniref:helix-turn-helix transcriptional regulator n=1 Tax=Anaerocolumna sp. AGMB13025 TaxID=3039116 RepID=UPI00241E29CA|nr:helix-turn-helix transcriptional regulator [Anaerocolumna sp. AGMB13025]WFR57008.1 helix-turn-helix transcriptional regulator [Anaerocolumna sp. AGMB13025]